MKRKLFAIISLVLALCGALVFFESQSEETEAVSINASAWDGKYVENEGELSSDDFYNDSARFFYIRSAKGFSYFASCVNQGYTFKDKIVYLETDIDLDNYAWTPIGNSSYAFQGTFYGKNHTIYNMAINNVDESSRAYNSDLDARYLGLFGIVSDYAKIVNLNLKSLNIDVKVENSSYPQNSEFYVGGLLGYLNNTANSDTNMSNTYIQNCSAVGNIKAEFGDKFTYHVGGLIGCYENSKLLQYGSASVNINIETSFDTGSSKDLLRVGGLVGTLNNANISSCYSDRKIESDAGCVGGLVGYVCGTNSNKAEISNSYNAGTISSSVKNSMRLGGLVGYVEKNTTYSNFSITNCYNSGDITFLTPTAQSYYIGGLVGYLQSPSTSTTIIKNCFTIGTIQRVDSYGNVKCNVFNEIGQSSGSTNGVYQLFMSTGSLTYRYLYYSLLDVDQREQDGNVNISAYGILNFKNIAKSADFYTNTRYWSEKAWPFSGWNAVWGITSSRNNGYPYLAQIDGIRSPDNDSDYSETLLEGEGTKESPYQIKTAADLGWVSFNYSSLHGTIENSSVYYALQNDIDLSGKTWQPIGSLANPFSDVFDGNGYTITGLTCSLQAQFGNHGLFGVAEDAVIKNLKVKSIVFANEGSEADGNLGAFIGLVRGNVYLINCVADENDKTHYTVGHVDKDSVLYVAMGKNNINLAENFTNNMRFSGNNDGKIYYAYDVVFSASGGNFYNTKQEVYNEFYHMLIIPKDDSSKTQMLQTGLLASEILLPISSNKKVVDSSYGSSLPQLSHLYGKTDIVIRKGYKAKSYCYNSDKNNPKTVFVNLLDTQEREVTSFDVNYALKPVLGIGINWESCGYSGNIWDTDGGVNKQNAQKLVVIYNAYEKDSFDVPNTTKYSNKSSVLVYPDEASDDYINNLGDYGVKNGYVYKVFYLEYDAFLSEYEEIFEIPEYVDSTGKTKLLRNGDFEIKNFYTAFSGGVFDKNKILNKNTLVNSNLTKTVYVEWEGKELQDKYQLKVQFSKADGIAGKLDYSDAVESIYFINPDEDREMEYSYPERTVNLERDGSISYSFDTQYSSKYDSSSYMKLVVTLKEGYSFSSTPTEGYTGLIDDNFGTLKSEKNQKVDSSGKAYQKQYVFYNLVANYKITFEIQRVLSSNPINIGQAVYFGFSPMVGNWENVAILDIDNANTPTLIYSMISSNEKDENGNTKQDSYSSTTNTNEEDKYIAYDFKNNRILSSSGTYDSFELDAKYKSSGKVVFRYELKNGEYRYFSYESSTELDENGEQIEYITLWELNSSLTQTDFIARLSVVTDFFLYNIEYYSKTSFCFVFSTDTNSTEFEDYTMVEQSAQIPTGSSKSNKKATNPDSLQATKVSMTFNNLIKLGGEITVSTIYTQALFNVSTAYLNENGELVKFGSEGAPESSKSPTVSPVSKIYPVSLEASQERGTIKIDVTSTNYMTFYADRSGSSRSVLYNKDSRLGTENTSLNYNIKITASYVNPEGSYNLVNFSDYNGYYIEASLTKSQEGHWEESIDGAMSYKQDKYTITLTYREASDSSGKGLQAGLYEVCLVCTDVCYSLDYNEKFVDAEDEVTEENFVDEENSSIFTNATVNAEKYTNKNERSIKYDDSISIKTYRTTNLAYEFYGWFVNGSNFTKIVKSSTKEPTASSVASLNFVYETYYAQGANEETNRYNITIFAIYVKKMTTLNLSENVYLVNENGTEGEESYRTANLNLQISLIWKGDNAEGEPVQENKSAVYKYKSKNEKSETLYTQLTGLSFSKLASGYNLGYNFVGYKILDKNRDVVSSYKAETGENFDNDIDLYDFIKEKMESGETSLIETYTIVPIIEQKTATIYFHSGTGTSEYGDGKSKGEVFDKNNEKTTDTIFSISGAYFGSAVYLNYGLDGLLNGVAETDIVVDDLFYTRTGYSMPANNYWACSLNDTTYYLNGSLLVLNYEYFQSDENEAEIHFFRKWSTTTYNIVFNANEGIFQNGETITLEIMYEDSTLGGNISAVNSVSRLGYSLKHWALSVDGGEVIFDNNLGIINNTSLFDEDGNYFYNGSANVYAIWEEQPYIIQLYLNSATAYTVSGGEKNLISTSEQKDYYIELGIDYGKTFADLLYQNNPIKLSDIVVERDGYKFDGVFVVDGNKRSVMEDSTVFLADIWGCDLTKTPALKLYVGWVFDSECFDLKLNSTTLENLTYNQQLQEVYLAEYFELGYTSSGYTITIENNNLVVTVSENFNTSIATKLTSSTATISNEKETKFKVGNVGDYIVDFNIELSDEANYLNLGTVLSNTYQFSISVDKAYVDFVMSDKIYLENVKRITEQLETSEFKDSVYRCENFDAFADLMKEKDDTITEESTNIDIYRYIMLKYFSMINTNTAREYIVYKEWNFGDFKNYETQHKEIVDTIVDGIGYFDFYDHENVGQKVEVNAYKYLTLNSNTVDNVENEIKIDRIVMSSNSDSDLQAKYYYEIRAYIVGTTSALENYSVLYDEDENAYLTVGMAYMMPEIYVVENLETTKSSYYDAYSTNKTVSWQGSRKTISYESEEYYKLEDGLYLKAKIYTSNSGEKDKNLEYSYKYDENYLYFDDVKILEVKNIDNEPEYTNVTEYYKLVMDEDDIFTILGIVGVANINVSASYMTIKEGLNYFETVEQSMATELLRITTVKYTLDGTSKEFYQADGLNTGIYADGGYVICEIRKNNDNQVSIFVNEFVDNVIVNTVSRDLTDYISLYKWSNAVTYIIDGTMETQGSLNIDLQEIEKNEDELTEIDYYAIYTDLVLVKYELNFPSTYKPSTIDSAIIKLGETKVDDLSIPSEKGFKLASLKATTPDGEKIDYDEIFTGEGDVYVGLNPLSKHAVLNLEAKWAVDDIQYISLKDQFKMAVQTFNSIRVSDVVALLNTNNGLYTYTYEWYFDGDIVSVGEILTLKNNGSYDESGEYKLVVKAELLRSYYSALADATETSSEIELTINFEFLRNLLESVTLPEADDCVKTYDGKEHLYDWTVQISYYVFNNTLLQYYEEPSSQGMYYSPNGSVYFKVFNLGNEVLEVKNAGVYTIKVFFNESLFDLSNIDKEALEFTYTIQACEVDLSQNDFSMGKSFNALEPLLSKDIYLSSGTVTLDLVRDQGEDAGEYNLYLQDIADNFKLNYVFKHGDVVLFENGVVTEDGKTTNIGKFTITSSGLLKIYYEVTESSPMITEAEFSEAGYTLNLTNDLRLQIFNDTVLFKEFELKLYDVVKDEVIEDQTILNIIKSKIEYVSPKFFTSFYSDNAKNSGVYNYGFEVAPEFNKYYFDVQFEQSYQFKIDGNLIDVSLFNFDKVYDGEQTIYIDTNGNEISLDTFKGIYLYAVYTSSHVGQNIRVDLNLLNNDDNINLSNYSLSINYAYATISKLSATMEIELTKESYIYGDVSVNNLSEIIKDYKVTDSQNNDVTSLLTRGYFTLSYDLGDASANDKGFVYKGEYDIDVDAEFQDFDMTISIPKLKITALQYIKVINQGYIQISVSDKIEESYQEEMTVSQTGDRLMLEYVAVGLTVGETASRGYYDLNLKNSSFLNGSIVVNLTENNQGLVVSQSDEILYVRISDTSILKKVYNGISYTISVDLDTKTFAVTNGVDNFESALSFYIKKNGIEENVSADEITLNSISIYSGNNQKTFSSCGNYRLNLNASVVEYSTVTFAEEYGFELDEIEIDVTQFVISKTYNGDYSYSISDFKEKISSDDGKISLLVKFDDNNAGTKKTAKLYLNGEAKNNYKLSNSEVLGTIEKAEAVVEFSQTEFVYGRISSISELPYSVKSNGVTVLSNNYSLQLQIVGAKYTQADYLEVGSYAISIVEGSIESNNYEISMNDTNIVVSAYQLDIEFDKSGEIYFEYGSQEAQESQFNYLYLSPLYETVELLLTRESGSDIGYYKILNGQSQNNNYVVNNLSDKSDLGAFRIVQAKERLYLLLSNEETLSEDDFDNKVSMIYDGNLYDVASIIADETGNYNLVISNSINTSIKQSFAGNFYTYNSEDKIYTKTNIVVEELSTTIKFLTPTKVKGVGNYELYASGTSSKNYDVRIGKVSEIYCITLEITKRQLYFKEATLSKVFDNQDAIFEYDDANEMLTGIVEQEQLSLTLKFMKNGVVGKYVAFDYSVSAELSGDTVENYQLNLMTEELDSIKASIERAEVDFTINTQEFVYGDEISLFYQYSSTVDLLAYQKTLTVVLSVDANENYSTSGNLKVGEYDMLLRFESDDFKVGKYIINGAENSALTAKVLIKERELELGQKTKPLKDVFTKIYDGTNSVDITENGELLFNITGIVSGEGNVSDLVTISSAKYVHESVGNSIQVDFLLSGDDSSNYVLKSWLYGIIKSVIIKLDFDYVAGGEDVKSNVDENGLETLSQIAFPFTSNSYLTANSASTTTNYIKNFPTLLTGKTGYGFLYWTMNFENVVNAPTEFLYLENLTSNIGIQKDYDGSTYSVRVDNGEKTVEFLKNLISDENDTFKKYYYKNNEDIEVKFTANWGTNKYRLTILLADENGQSASRGKVTLPDGTVVTNNYLNEFDYDSSISLQIEANEHCYLDGIYTADGRRYTGEEENIEIGKNGDIDQFTILNIRTNYALVIRFATQTVNLVLDFQTCTDATVQSEDFISIGDNKYQWTTNYLNLEGKFVGYLPEINRVGYVLNGFVVSGQTIMKSDFNTTLITSLLGNSEDKTLTLTFKPNFDAVGVVVTLNYNYDEKTKIISVPFGQAYGMADGWEENPERIGYEFVGWYDSSDNKIVGTLIIETVEAHTLTARWSVLKFRLDLNVKNATILNSSLEFTAKEGGYFADEVAYEQVVTFVVFANSGYEISSAWAKEFEVVINEDKTANVAFTMPASDYSYDLPILPIANTVTILGQHIETCEVYDITETESLITVENNQFKLSTGRNVKIIVHAEVGYEMIDEVTFSSREGLTTTSPIITNGVLTICVEGIKNDLEITFATTESKNNIQIEFEDNSVVDVVDISGKSYNDIEDLPIFEVMTNSTFTFYVKFNHGYSLESCQSEQFSVNNELITEGVYTNYYKIDVTGIYLDGKIRISATLAKFTLLVEAVSYDENKNLVTVEDNKAFVNGKTSVEVDFNTTVVLTNQIASLYSFAGWSRDKIAIFSTENSVEYNVVANETIYAIFSTLKFDIEFSTLNYYTLYEEYNTMGKTETRYDEISTGRYFDADSGEELSKIDLYYGANKTIKFKMPDGYMYYGYGYKENGKLVYIDINESVEREVELTISSRTLNEETTNLKIYVIVKAYSVSINFKTQIDIDGTREDDVDVGWIAIQDQEGDDVNRYGYLEGTRVHYSPDDFENRKLVSNKAFTVIAYTGEVFYLKVQVLKEGYRFYSLFLNNQNIQTTRIEYDEDYIVYEIDNLIGGIEEIDIEVLFRPYINVINLNFINSANLKIDGGNFTLKIDSVNQNKVWTSGREYSAVTVSAYTDSCFDVVAYVRMGYYVDANDLQIEDVSSLIVAESLKYESLTIQDSGYTGKITFKVKGYLGVANISIKLIASKYKILLKEENETLLEINNVNFGNVLDLTEYNYTLGNISIYDDRITFVNGKLKLSMKKDQHNFEGFFTYQNGAGVQYIDSDGNAVGKWQESGYVLDPMTSKYILSENASYILDENGNPTGEIEISLYLYWSYLKTRISFEFEPTMTTNYTVKDMISGIDYSNSWYYETSPLYIEVSFNTDIHIKAPELAGYKFYKFVISQKNADGTWLSDVTSFADDIPWSTNEYDRIVECKIKIVYFAQVDVTVFGGEGTFEITQDHNNDGQAKLLLQQGYVDTTKSFKIEAVASDGFEFVRWINSSSKESYYTQAITLQIREKTNLTMNLQGETVVLNFEAYNTNYGQMTTLRTASLDNSYESYRLGGYSGETFIKLLTEVNVKVGDELTFVLSVDYGFSVVWNRKDIEFVEYSGNLYYFSMIVPAADAGKMIDIIPEFKDEVLSVYITREFISRNISDNSTDMNLVDMAGYVAVNGQKVSFITSPRETDISITTITNTRYAIDNIKIENYDTIYDNMNEFFTDSGVILLTKEYLEAKNIVGTIHITIQYMRVLWEDQLVTDAFDGQGTSKNPYQIKTIEDLNMMMQYVNNGTFNKQGVRYKDCSYVLMADLELTEKFWTPIGTDTYSFNGYFNFNNHKISGIYTAYMYEIVSYGGLFGVLGANAQVVQSSETLWYVYLVIGLVILLIVILIIIILLNRKRKKKREELSKR